MPDSSVSESMFDRVYVAGSSKEVDRAAAAIEMCRSFGLQVTNDWPSQIRKYGTANADVPAPDGCLLSLSAKTAVESSDLFLVLLPGEGAGSIGMWIELGIMFARGTEMFQKSTAISAGLGPSEHEEVRYTRRALEGRVRFRKSVTDRSIFFHHVETIEPTDMKAIGQLAKISQRLRE